MDYGSNPVSCSTEFIKMCLFQVALGALRTIQSATRKGKGILKLNLKRLF